jgi:hypothetical protein
MVAELSAMQQHGMLPDWVKFQVNSRSGFVEMDLATLPELTAWAAALGFHGEPTRYTYADEHAVRWNVRIHDPLSGWKFDLNARLFLEVGHNMLALTDDNVDAIELVLERGA